MTECPDCGATVHGAVCPHCGWRVPAAAARAPSDAWQCAWTTEGRRCRLPGTIGQTNARCTWHATVDPRVQSLEELDRWVEGLREWKACCVWTHYPAGVLWDWMHGRAVAADPHKCEQARCPHAAEAEVDPRSGVEQARAFRAHLTHLLRTPLVDAPRRSRPAVRAVKEA